MRIIYLILSTLIALLTFSPAASQEVYIYSDDGTWEDGIVALEHFFDNQNVIHSRLYAKDLNESKWNKEALAIVFPGGYSYNYQIAIELDAIDELRDYVANGGGYIGICAGAYFASKTVAWEGGVYPYELGLFDGTATGSLNYISPWPSYTMTDITLNGNNPLATKAEKISVLYYGGPIFTPNEGVEIDTLATWNSADNTPASINFIYEKGRVLLIGPHLEIEESDERDGTDFASELDDKESDWDVLEKALNWVLNKSITSSVDYSKDNDFYINENPVRSTLSVKSYGNNSFILRDLKIVNSIGNVVLSIDEISNTFDLSWLTNGVYFVNANIDGISIRLKFIKE